MSAVEKMVGTEGNEDYVVACYTKDGKYRLGMKAFLSSMPVIGVPVVGVRVRAVPTPVDGALAVDASGGKVIAKAFGPKLADKWTSMDEKRVSLNMVKPLPIPVLADLFAEARETIVKMVNQMVEFGVELTDEAAVLDFLHEQLCEIEKQVTNGIAEKESDKGLMKGDEGVIDLAAKKKAKNDKPKVH